MSSNAIKKHHSVISELRKGIRYRLLFFSMVMLWGAVYAACPEPAKFTIALDVGHTPSNPGRISARGIPEYQFNRRLAEKIQQRLHAAGFTDTFILTEKNPDMPLFVRGSLANVRNARLLLSVHHDSVQQDYLSTWMFEGKEYEYSDHFQGYSLFVSKKNPAAEASQAFAGLLGQALTGYGFTPTLHHAEPIAGENRTLLDQDKGIYQFDDLLILKNTKVPAVLMECGVLVNRDEEILVSHPVYQNALADAVVRAVEGYFTQACEVSPP